MRILAGLALAIPLLGQTKADEFFEKSVRPILVSKCYACHGSKVQMAGLNLATGAGLTALVGRVVPAISYTEEVKMPPTGKLSAEEIATLREWVGLGAPWPKAEAAVQSVAAPVPSTHWAFQPVQDPALPSVRNEGWVKNPIDRLILAKLEEKGLSPAPPASKLTLLRRVTYDLTGLPPTLDEIAAFSADNSPKAFEKVVDRLLASPQYGERWGRHWLDVARYADSTGMDEDHIYPHAWRYRDYVVKAFNDDLPFNEFIKQQIAGDLLPAVTAEARQQGIIATGFLALGPKPLAQQDRVQMIYDVVDEQIDTTSKAFLGLTVACARCHDHKFDPIRTKDYYSLASIFASTMDFRNLGKPGSVSHIYYAPLEPAAYDRYQAHRWRTFGKQLEMEDALSEDSAREYGLLRPRIAELLRAAWKVQFQGVTADNRQVEQWVRWLKQADEKAKAGYLKKLFEATEATIGDVSREYQESYLKSATRWDEMLAGWRRRFATEAAEDREFPARPKFDVAENAFFEAATFHGGPMELADGERVAQLRAELQQLEASMPPEPAMASAVCEGAPVDQRVFLRGDHHSKGDPVGKTFPLVLASSSQVPVAKGSGRLELAAWLASTEQPMTARVMANRIWQWHFGEALMRTPNNWGRTGDVPVQKELLDYLAKRFVENGWSIKAMHRMILLSNTYQMSSMASKEAREADPANRLCSRFNRVRMSVEQIRDSILFVDGSLDRTIGGSLFNAKKEPVDPEAVTRRTLYIPVRRGSIPTLLGTFDFGDATSPGDGRGRSNVAPQALFMMNSRLVQERSKGFAMRLLGDISLTDRQRVERAYLMTLTRKPDAGEVDQALSYIGSMDEREKAWQSFCHILLATNEFLYLN